MLRSLNTLTGLAALLMIVLGLVIGVVESRYPFVETFHHDLGRPVLALELSEGNADIEAVLHRMDRCESAVAIAIQRRANQLDLLFIPIYTFYLWIVARLFRGQTSSLLTVAIVLTGICDYWEDARIFKALDGGNPAISEPSLCKWSLLAIVLIATGFILNGAGGRIYSVATNRLLALAYWSSGILMGATVITGLRSGFYSLIPLSTGIVGITAIVHTTGLLGRFVAIPDVRPTSSDPKTLSPTSSQ